MASIPDFIARDIATWLRRGVAFPGVMILEQWADLLERSCDCDDESESLETNKNK